jgi:hypothetical protein
VYNTWGGQFSNIGITLGDETSAGEINNGWGRTYGWGITSWYYKYIRYQIRILQQVNN